MPKPFDLPYRQIHLDFHTSPFIPDVGKDFDARDFARTMKKAHVNSVTVFAKCHHGHLYYNTPRAERHPGLKPRLNLLGQQVEALHREGIRAPIYISVMCDEFAADTHPEWICRAPDGKTVGAGPLEPGWQIVDMASPYQEYLAEQTREVLRLFRPVDGIFFDMCWDQPSVSNFAVEAMIRNNLNPELEADRATHARNVVRAYMKRFHKMVRDSSKSATVYFNGRPYHNLAEDVAYQTQVEIEALPTGGWGYMYFPKNVRYARTFDRPYLGMTARFHKSWADFGGLKPYPALEYETAQMIAHGARCSVGDQLHPRGVLDRATYDLIGNVYARVAAAEPYIHNSKPVSQIGLFQLASAMAVRGVAGGGDEGATRLLTQLKHQFDVVTENSRDLDRYELLILPDNIALTPDLVKKVRAYLKNGGKLLASGTSGLNSDGTQLLLPELAIKPEGFSPFTTTYMRFVKEISEDVPPADHVMYEKGIRVTPAKGATSLARVVEPYFDRSWKHFSSHFQTPGDKLSRFSAAVQKGNVAYIAYPIFAALGKHGNYPYRLLVRNILARLIDPLVRIDAPTGTEVTVMQSGPRTIVHILHYSPERRAANFDIIDDIVPLHDIPLAIKLKRAPRRVFLAPEEIDLHFDYHDSRATLLIPEIAGHQMVVFQ